MDVQTRVRSRAAIDAHIGSVPTAAIGSAPTAALGSAPTALGVTGAEPLAAAPAGSLQSRTTVVATQEYEITREHARGGMGRILIATDATFGRDVAVKELLAADGDLRARFEREASITAALQHPGVVPVYASGTQDGRPFYAMRLVTGSTLAAAFAAASDLEARLALLPQVLSVVETMAYAHKHGVIHRDLKPANVMVGEFGEAIVLDWGLGKRVGDTEPSAPQPSSQPDAELTHVGMTLGTPAYMPVEQARGEVVDARADVYALGAILYELFASAPPYIGRRADDVLAAVLAGPPPALVSSRGVPSELVAIVQRAMARDASERYADAGALADDLRRYLRGQLVSAHSYSTAQLIGRWVRRHRAAVVVAILAVLALVLTMFVAFRRLVDERDRTQEQRTLAEHRRQSASRLIQFALDDLGDSLGELGRLDLLEGLGTQLVAYYATPGNEARALQDVLLHVEALKDLADIARDRSKLEESAAQLSRALAVAEGWSPRHDAAVDDAQRFELALRRASLLVDLATARYRAEKMDESRAYATRAKEAARTVLAWPVPADRRQAMLGSKSSLLGTLHDLYILLGDHTASTSVADEQIAVSAELLATQPARAEYQRAAAYALFISAYEENNAGRLETARTYNARALAIIQPLVNTATDASDLDVIAAVLNLQGALVEGPQRRAVLEQALTVATKLRQLDPSNARAAAGELAVARQAALSMLADGDAKTALTVLDERQPILAQVRGVAAHDLPFLRIVAYADNGRGRVLAALHRRDDAIATQRGCMTAMKRVSATTVEPDVIELACAASLAEVLGPHSAEGRGLAAAVREHLDSPANASMKPDLEAALREFPR